METRHLGIEVHRLEKIMLRERMRCMPYQDADRLTGTHGYWLKYLYENRNRNIFQRDIEKQFSVSRSTVTVALQLMEKNGLIVREGVAQDARLKRITLTEKAIQLNQQIREEIETFEKKLTKGISEEEAAVFLRVIQKMRKNLGEKI